ncbi:Nephrocystin-3 [Trichoplax sp. H2]|nr:Nephrocystin-3 [Trichoplax sp. H2]|eukprot:RDD37542.1 Nephrocystin-3 [Trichoplax sp. H2]
MGNHMNKLDKLSVDEKTVLCQLAEVKRKTNDLQTARFYYELVAKQMLAKNAKHGGQEENLCYIYYLLSKVCLLGKELLLSEKYNRKAETIAQKMNDQPRIAELLDIRGDIRRLEGKYEQAIEDLEKSLQIKFQIVGASDRSTGYTYYKLGKVYFEQSKYDQAMSLYHKAMDTRKNSFDEDDAELHHDVGLAYSRLLLYDKAEKMFNKALNIKSNLPETNEKSIGNSCHCLGVIYYRQSKYEMALRMHQRVLAIMIKSPGKNHSGFARSYFQLGVTYFKLAKYDEALDMHKRALHLWPQMGKGYQVNVAASFEKLGITYHHLCRYVDAISAFEKALKIWCELYGSQHMKVATSYNNIGIAYGRLSQHDKAIDMYEKTMKILIHLGREGLAQMAIVSSNLNKILNEQNKEDNHFRHNTATRVRICDHSCSTTVQRPKSYPTETENKNCESRTKFCHMESSIDDDEESSIDHYEKMGDISSLGCLDNNHEENRAFDLYASMRSITSTESLNDNHGENRVHNYENDHFQAFVKTLKEGECRSNFTRIMIFGPDNVGKSSIMKLFTEEGLPCGMAQTNITGNTNKMLNEIFYNICNKTVCDYRNSVNNKIFDAVERIRQKNFMSNNDGGSESNQAFNNVPSSSPNKEMDSSIARNKMQHHLGSSSFLIADSKPLLKESINLDSQSNPLDQSIDSNGESVFLWQHADTPLMASLQINFLDIYKELCQRQLQMSNLADTEDCQYGKLWDFGGHSIYNVTHQPFISANGIYILVFNIAHNINDKIVKRDGFISDMTYLQVVQEWLTSIIGTNSCREKIQAKRDQHTEEYCLPVVILVASHADKIERELEQIRRFKRFEQALISNLPAYRCNIYSSQIIFNCNPKDNCQSVVEQRRECCRRLHHIINKLATSISFIRNAVPIRWYVTAEIMYVIANKRLEQEPSCASSNGLEKGRKIVREEEVRQLARDYGLYENDEDLRSMLQYLHDLGEIVYCPTGTVDGIVVLEVDWLLNIFRETIYLDTCLSKTATVIDDYRQAVITGKISKKYFDYMLQGFDLDEHDRELVLKLMVKYDIICPIQSDDKQNPLDQLYFVPYLLQPDVEYFDLARYTLSDWLYIGYARSDIPYISDSIYYSLLSSCSKEWNNSLVKLYHHGAKYYLKDSYSYIIIEKGQSHIGIQYYYQNEHEDKDLRVIMKTVKEFIHIKRPQDLIRKKLTAIVKQRLPKFKSVDSGFYVSCIICQQFTRIEPDKKLNTCLSKSATVSYYYQQSVTIGKISKRYFDYMLQGFNSYAYDKRLVLKLMVKYDIICPIQSDDRQNSLDLLYFIPSLLQPDAEYFDLAKYTRSK